MILTPQCLFETRVMCNMWCARFIGPLGHGDIWLWCDQEPGRRVFCENSQILDHAPNSWVEKSIDRVRNPGNVFLHQVRKMLEVD